MTMTAKRRARAPKPAAAPDAPAPEHDDIATAAADDAGAADKSDDATEPQQTTSDLDRAAEEAWTRIKDGHHWRDWVAVGKALAFGRNESMRLAQTNEPKGPRFKAIFERWMNDRPWAKQLGSDTARGRLLWCIDNLDKIEAWRLTLPAERRARLNHPSWVKQTFEAIEKKKAAGDPAADQATPKQKATAQLADALTTIESLEKKLRDADRVVFKEAIADPVILAERLTDEMDREDLQKLLDEVQRLIEASGKHRLRLSPAARPAH
jgi:hypothetical protein